VDYKQHLLLGGVCSVGTQLVLQSLSITFQGADLVIYYGATALGSLLPDIDHPNSYLGRRTWGWIIAYHDRQRVARKIHRKLTHSLLFVAGVAVCTMGLGCPAATIAVSVGLTSHLIGDMMTPSGVPLLYPSKERYKLPFQIRAF
jgi:inner membrane protein